MVKNFSWWEVILIYEIGLITIFYLVTLIWGDLEDREEI